MIRILFTFLLGAFLGGGLMGWALIDTARSSTRNQQRALDAVEAARVANSLCLGAYQELWSKIEAGRKAEARKAMADNQQWGGE